MTYRQQECETHLTTYLINEGVEIKDITSQVTQLSQRLWEERDNNTPPYQSPTYYSGVYLGHI